MNRCAWLCSGLLAASVALAAASCSGSSADTSGPGGGSSSGQSSSGAGAGSGSSSTSSGSTSSGSTSSGAGGSLNPPPPTCPAPITAVDVTTPAAVVGSGTAASCTEAALDAALATGGVVTFDCGAAPLTLIVTSEKALKMDTVLDGGGLVTLSGGGKTRILHLASAWDQKGPKLTVQHLGFVDGFTTDALDTKDTTQGGAAIFRDGGSLDVIDCHFSNNTCASTGQDVSGGAITSQGVGDTVIVGSVFQGNSGSNGGAVGNLGNGLTLVDDTFDGNSATGTDGNPGNGGNGGAVVFDGAMTTMAICGSAFTKNKANAQGGAVFRVAYTDEPTTIDRSTFDGNVADATVGLAGALYLEFTTITMTASVISGNSAHYGGGIWIGHKAIANLTNVTIANNTSDQGGGIWFAGQVTGTFTNITFAGNSAPSNNNYGSGSFGDGTAVKLVNSLVVDNGCYDNPLDSAGAVNLEFWSAGKSGKPCSTNPLAVDPLLGPLLDNGGPTKTMAPGAGSPAIGKGTGCPATDQRGNARKEPCTLGAYEAG